MRTVLLMAALVLAPQETSSSITGKWTWQGQAGWQRIVLELKADGPRLTGILRMGPGGGDPKSPKDYWEYFFDPTDFKLTNGKITDNTIYFEQEYIRPPVPPGPFFDPPTRGGGPTNSGDGKFVYRGTVQGNQISFTRENVSGPKDAWSIGRHQVSFTVKREN